MSAYLDLPSDLKPTDPQFVSILNQTLARMASGNARDSASTSGSATATPAGALQSPLDFGGAGDGVADDTAAVLAASNLGYLWLPPRKVFVTRQIGITQYGWECFGGGAVKLKDGEGTDLFALDGSSYTGSMYPGNGLYCRITGVQLIGNAARQPVGSLGACLSLKNAAYTVVERCLIYGASGDGIRLENANGCFQADEVNLLSNFVFSNGRHGIYLHPTCLPVSTTIAASLTPGSRTVTPASMANITLGATLIVANADNSNLEYVVVTAVTASTFSGTFATAKSGPGITVVSTWGHVGDHVIKANHCNYNNEAGIRGTRLTSTIIAENNVLTNAIGIYLDAADRCTLIGNAVRNNKGTGVIIDEDQSGNGFGRSEQILIQSNQLHYNNVQAGGSTPADELDVWHTDGCVIAGNYLGDTDFTPMAWYGIQLEESVTGIVIANNTFGPTKHGPLLAPQLSLQVYTETYSDIAVGSQVVTPASMANVTVGKVLQVQDQPSLGAWCVESVKVTAVTGTTFTATFASAHTQPVLISAISQTPYRSIGNIGLSDGMQGSLAGGYPGPVSGLPVLAENDYGLLYTVNDYGHTLLWIGAQWVFSPGDNGAGYIVNSAGGVITSGVWYPCTGTPTSILNHDGSTQVVTTPNLGAGYYMRR